MGIGILISMLIVMSHPREFTTLTKPGTQCFDCYISEEVSNKNTRVIFLPGRKLRYIVCFPRPHDHKKCVNTNIDICPRINTKGKNCIVHRVQNHMQHMLTHICKRIVKDSPRLGEHLRYATKGLGKHLRYATIVWANINGMPPTFGQTSTACHQRLGEHLRYAPNVWASIYGMPPTFGQHLRYTTNVWANIYGMPPTFGRTSTACHQRLGNIYGMSPTFGRASTVCDQRLGEHLRYATNVWANIYSMPPTFGQHLRYATTIWATSTVCQASID